MQFVFRCLLVGGLGLASLGCASLNHAAISSARAGDLSSDSKSGNRKPDGAPCNAATCLAYCQGFCDAVRLRCKKTGSRQRHCRARGYRSCMNGCGWEICKLRPGERPAYQCRRHPDL